MKTIEELYEELRDKYSNQDNYDALTFMGNEQIPEGLTYWEAWQLFMKLANEAENMDFFVVKEGNEEGMVNIMNAITLDHRQVPEDNIYPNRLKGEEWDEDECDEWF